MPTIRVAQSRGGEYRGNDCGRADQIRAWLATLSPVEYRALIAALRQGNNAAGDWLEAHGRPRTWRKQMRVEG